MTPYILQVALIIAGCLAFYKVLLQKETFYRVNRFILISCLVMAFALPLIPVPQQFSFRKAEEKTLVQVPVIPVQQSAAGEKTDAGDTVIYPTTSTAETSTANFTMEKLFTWLGYLYWFGVGAFALSFLLQVIVLFYRAYRSPVIIDGRYRIVEVSGDKAPCSFGNNIFINPANYEWETYNQILQHEKVHIRQKHSMDLLLAEFVLIFQWFNPFAWIYRKEMENNLEFLTDAHLVENEQVEKSSYQISLLKVSSPQLPLSLTTNYNQSLLKKRIAMMNAKKSNLHTSWKYFFLLPLLVLFASVMNEPVAQTKPQKNMAVDVKKNIDAQVQQNVELKQEQPQNRNPVVPQPKVQKNVQTKASEELNIQQADQNRQHLISSQKGMETEGSWFATIKADKIEMQFRQDGDEEGHRSTNNSTFNVSDFSSLPRGNSGTFKLSREAGTMEFTGKFEGDQGMGKYKFVGDKQYADEMNKELEESLKERDLMVFFFINVKRSYVKMIKAAGYKDVTKNDIIPLVALKVDETYISTMKESGLGELTLKDLIPLKSMNIDRSYIDELSKAGLKNLNSHNVVALKSQKVTGEYVRGLKTAAVKEGSEIEAQDIIAMKALKIDDGYINSFREVGMTHIAKRDIIPMKSMGITAEFVKGFYAIGYKNIDAQDLVAMKSQGITPDFIKGFNEIGYPNVPVQEIISLKAMGVTAAYVKDMKSKGFDYPKLNKYITLKSIGDH